MLLLQVIHNYYSFHHHKVERVSKLPSSHRHEGLAEEPSVSLNLIVSSLIDKYNSFVLCSESVRHE